MRALFKWRQHCARPSLYFAADQLPQAADISLAENVYDGSKKLQSVNFGERRYHLFTHQ